MIFEPRKIKSATVSPSICHESWFREWWTVGRGTPGYAGPGIYIIGGLWLRAIIRNIKLGAEVNNYETRNHYKLRQIERVALEHTHCCCFVHSLSSALLFATSCTAAPRLPCPSPSPRVCSHPCLLSPWCHPTISSSVSSFSSCPQSSPASGSFLVSQLFASGGQSIRASASVLPMNIQDWFPLVLQVWSPCSPRDSQESFPTPQWNPLSRVKQTAREKLQCDTGSSASCSVTAQRVRWG